MLKMKYRVLATDWESENYIECWTVNRESAERIAKLLKTSGDVTVQIDEVKNDVNS